ncbi:MAG: type II secretion system protein [Candidatus Paceibacterota bacterium]
MITKRIMQQRYPHIFFKEESGFTLIEILIYAVIFSVSAVFLVNILTSITQTQVRQTSINEVNQQVSFVGNTIQRFVREASLIQNDVGVASSTLLLRMASSSIDQTLIFVDASSTAIYLKQINIDGTSTTIPLTDDKVTIGNFSITKYEVPGGSAVAQVDFTLNYNTSVTRAKVARTWRGAISRISAATFDSSLAPATTNSLDVGSQTSFWKDGYFAGNIFLTGKLGVGTGYDSGIGSWGVQMKSTGNVGVSLAGGGIILKGPGGVNCFLVSVGDTGTVTSTAATCP